MFSFSFSRRPQWEDREHHSSLGKSTSDSAHPYKRQEDTLRWVSQSQQCNALFRSGHCPLVFAGNCARLITQQHFLPCDLYSGVEGKQNKTNKQQTTATKTFWKIHTLLTEQPAGRDRTGPWQEGRKEKVSQLCSS